MRQQKQQSQDIIQDSFNSLPFQPLYQENNLNCSIKDAFSLLPNLTHELSVKQLQDLRQRQSNNTQFMQSQAMCYEPFVPLSDQTQLPQTQCFKTRFRFGQREDLEYKQSQVNKQITIRYGIDVMAWRIGLASLMYINFPFTFAIKEQLKMSFKQGKPSKEIVEEGVLLDDSDHEVNKQKLQVINQKISIAAVTMLQYLQKLIFQDNQNNDKIFTFNEGVEKLTIDQIIEYIYKNVEKNSLYLLRTVVSPKMQNRNQIAKVRPIDDQNAQSILRPLTKELLRLINLGISNEELFFTDDEALKLSQKNARQKQQAIMQDQQLKQQTILMNNLYSMVGQIFELNGNEDIQINKLKFVQQNVAAPHPHSIPPPDSNIFFYNKQNAKRDITLPIYNLSRQPPDFFLYLTRHFTNLGVQLSNQKRAVYYNSQSHGYGLFPLQQINKNEIVSEYAGELISNAQSELRDKCYQKNKFLTIYMFSITDNDCIDASFLGNYGRFMNHSCTNTAASTQIIESKLIHQQYQQDDFKHIYNDDSDHAIGIDIVAQRRIEMCEEATQNYNMEEEPYDKKITCNCQSRSCCGLMN